MPNLFTMPTIENQYNYKYLTKLDEVSYIIHMLYSLRKDSWFFSLHTFEDVPIISGLKVKMGSDLLQQFRHKEGIPAGRLVVVNWEDKEEANLKNFGKKVLFSYIGES